MMAHERIPPPADRCPDQAALWAFAQGTLAEDVGAVAIADHLADCVACAEFLAAETADWSGGPFADGAFPRNDLAAGLLDGGWRLGKYQVREVLGRGGFGVVLRARDEHLGRDVALKVLRHDVADQPQRVARFLREMRSLGQLRHPAIVQAWDAGEIDGQLYLAMEYVDGITLAALLRDPQPPPPLHEICRLVRDAADALEYLRGHGVVHRDIKPSNLMVAADGMLKILDLGVAHLPPEGISGDTHESELTESGQAIGTPSFMAPEQLRGQGVDIRADIYALGRVLADLLDQQAAGGQATPRAMTRLRRVANRMTAADPASRYQTPAEVVRALERFARPPRFAAWTRRRWVAAAAAALMVGLIIAGVGWSALGDAESFVVHFRDEFKSPSLDPARWRIAREQVFLRRQAVTLRNRGCLVTREEFPGPLMLDLDWKWLSDEGSHCDYLLVALRTSGVPGEPPPYKLTDGLIVQFMPWATEIQVYRAGAPRGTEALASALGIDMDRGSLYHIRIVDDGSTVTVYFGNEAAFRSNPAPVLTVNAPDTAKRHHLAFYNREQVGDRVMQSSVDNITISRPRE